MKHLSLFLAVFALCSNIVFAQKKNVTIATMALDENQLKKAKKHIDLAIQDETTKNLPRTWKIRGDIYYAIHINKLKDPTLDKDAVEKAFNSYETAIKLGNEEMADKASKKGKEPKPYRDEKLIKDNYKVISDGFQSEAIVKYNENDKESAVRFLMTSIQIDNMINLPKDTVAHYYTAIMASEIEDNDTALEYFKKTAELNYGVDVSVKDEKTGVVTKSSKKAAQVLFQIGLLSMEKGDTAKAMEAYENSVKRFPKESAKSLQNIISYYINCKQTDKAIDYLNSALEREPENAAYHTALGELYDQKAGNLDEKQEEEIKNLQDKAIKHYGDAMKFDPSYPNPFFNTGVIIFNRGVMCNKKARDLPFFANKANPEYDKLIAKQLEYYKKAAPYFENYLTIEQEDKKALNILMSIYRNLDDQTKLKEIKEKLDALK